MGLTAGVGQGDVEGHDIADGVEAVRGRVHLRDGASARPSEVGTACAGGAAAIRPVAASGREPRRAGRRLREKGLCDVIGVPF